MVEQAGAERLGGESALLIYNGPLTGITLWAAEMAQRVKAFAEYPYIACWKLEMDDGEILIYQGHILVRETCKSISSHNRGLNIGQEKQVAKPGALRVHSRGQTKTGST